MGQRRIAVALGVLGLLFCPAPAHALDRVAGDGFGYVVPKGFQAAPRALREASEKLCVEVSSQIPLALTGRPTFRMHIVPETPEFPEAAVSAYTFTLPEGQNQPSLTTVELDDYESGVLQGLSSINDARVASTVHRNLGSDLLSVVSILAYEHKEAGPRLLRVALITRKHVACLLMLDSPADREGTYRVHWDGIVGSLRLATKSNEAGFLLRNLPLVGVGLGAIAVLVFAFFSHLRRRHRERMRPHEDAGFRGNTISDLKGSRAVDGLGIFDQEEPPPRESLEAPDFQQSPPPLAAPPMVGPSVREPARVPAPPKDENALDFDIPVRKFDKDEVITGAGVAGASPGEDRPARRPVERRVLSASPRKPKGPPKIVRNDEYLRPDE